MSIKRKPTPPPEPDEEGQPIAASVGSAIEKVETSPAPPAAIVQTEIESQKIAIDRDKLLPLVFAAIAFRIVSPEEAAELTGASIADTIGQFKLWLDEHPDIVKIALVK